ncbi:DUF6160 family protein [Alkanindiges sp. WGS2144]|uniref:putative pilus system protein FilA n=1 Tax=Alkanindiges sp. WGS2144 TaxID=3366808 RepID=UPI003752ADEB
MKTLTKIALVSAMAISSSAFALESLDDSALSATTGQDGITIKLDAQQDGTIFGADNIVVHDKDGVGNNNGVSNTGAGAIVLGKGAAGIQGFNIMGTASDAVTIKVDADSNGTAPVLNVNVALPDELEVNTGDIYVASSGGIAADANAQFANESKILDNINISLGGAEMNIQLGNTAQGAMIVLDGNVDGGINIAGLALTDNSAGAGGKITIDNINVRDAGGANLGLATDIKVTNDGLSVIRTGGDVDVRLSGVQLGSVGLAHNLGDVAILGMAVPNITISGHN